MSEADTNEESQGRPFQLPPATFEFLTESLRMQAEMQLGWMRDPSESEPPADLEMARHTIDLLGVLQEKTRGNLTLEEQRLLDNSLTLLRFRYVQASEEARRRESAPKQSAQTESEQKPAEQTQTAGSGPSESQNS
jgi:Domain of unknown function (DUF1844)